MTAVLLWKEYRQQRTVWLAIAFLAILLVVVQAETLGHGYGLQPFQDEKINWSLNLLLQCLIVTFGVVSGALLLAGEREDGTLVFVDCLTARRRPLWAIKCVAGILLTLSLSLALTALALGLRFGSWDTVILLPLHGLDALVWGMLGGALCRRVLTAVLTGIVFMAVSWFLFVPFPNSTVLVLGQTAAVVAAAYASWRTFCKSDYSRRSAPMTIERKAFSILPVERSLAWQAMRQARWLLAACLAIALFLGFMVHKEPIIFWPLGTLLLGLTCGLAVFAFDQHGGSRFLGAQRFPPGRIWFTRILFWGVVLSGLTALAWCVDNVGGIGLFPTDRFDANTYNKVRGYKWFDELGDERSELISPAVFLGLWPLYGFCFGQFFGQLMRRPFLAVILACFLAPLAVSLWIPSLLFGGVTAWQLVALPLLLLPFTRLTFWPWLSERLWTGKPLVGLLCAVALIVLVQVGCLWYRVAEVPDVGEPFDVKAFAVEIRAAGNNEAGPLIRKACAEMQEHRMKVGQQIELPKEPIFQDEFLPKWGQLTNEDRFERLLSQILEQGWPKQDKEIGLWLDRLFEGAWVHKAERAAQLPLGMVQDPRMADVDKYISATSRDCRFVGILFTVRAFQLQARGDARAALQHLETVLALSRQVSNDAPLSLKHTANTMESFALTGLQVWLRNLGPDKDLFRTALAVLQRHEAALLDPVNAIKVEYLVYRYSDAISPYSQLARHKRERPFGEFLRAAREVPWEKGRRRRIADAIATGLLNEAEKPYWQTGLGRGKNVYNTPYAQEAVACGLPPKEGPGSQLSLSQWGELLQQLHMYGNEDFTSWPLEAAARSHRRLRGEQLAIAATLYQVDHGGPPDKLDDLVPAYLPVLPVDPITGEPFSYRISKGEELEIVFKHPTKLVPGQALIWCERPMSYFLVPFWKK